jgi:hypothetical protein
MNLFRDASVSEVNSMYSKIPYQTGAKAPQVNSTPGSKPNVSNQPQILQGMNQTGAIQFSNG